MSYQQASNKWFKVFAKIRHMLIQFRHVFQPDVILTEHSRNVNRNYMNIHHDSTVKT